MLPVELQSSHSRSIPGASLLSIGYAPRCTRLFCGQLPFNGILEGARTGNSVPKLCLQSCPGDLLGLDQGETIHLKFVRHSCLSLLLPAGSWMGEFNETQHAGACVF